MDVFWIEGVGRYEGSVALIAAPGFEEAKAHFKTLKPDHDIEVCALDKSLSCSIQSKESWCIHFYAWAE